MVNPPPAAGGDPTRRGSAPAKLDARTAEVLTRMYLDRRVNYQLEYYQRRTREYTTNSDLMFRLGALVMALSSLLAAIGTQIDLDSLQLIALLTALLPALAALLAAFRQLYQWDRQADLYGETILGLEEARLSVPDLDDLDAYTALSTHTQLVGKTEEVLKAEVDQWGQIALGKAEDSVDIDAVRAFAEQYGLALLNTDGEIDQTRLESVRRILEAAQSPPVPAPPHRAALSPPSPPPARPETPPPLPPAEDAGGAGDDALPPTLPFD